MSSPRSLERVGDLSYCGAQAYRLHRKIEQLSTQVRSLESKRKRA